MKRVLLVFSLVVFIGALQAEPNRDSYSRTITKFGGSYTVGDAFSLDNLGCGLTSMKYRFFNPMKSGGFYYGLIGADIKRTFGGVSVGDVRPVTIGWRDELAGPLGLDLSFTPIVGSRIVDDSVSESFYLGVRPQIGTYIALGGNLDLEFSYEPMIQLLGLCGSAGGYAIYHDVSLYLVFKKYTLTRTLPWK